MGLDVRYVRSGGVSIAYQVVGEAETDLVFVPDFCSNLVYAWESRYWRPFYERLAQSFRLILFDKRGTGLSDRGGAFPTLETRMEDVRAVLAAVGSRRAVVLGSHEGCLMATLFAATYPESTIALALFHPSLIEYLDPKYLEGLPSIRERWGTQDLNDEILGEDVPHPGGDARGPKLVRQLAASRGQPRHGIRTQSRLYGDGHGRGVHGRARADGRALSGHAARLC